MRRFMLRFVLQPVVLVFVLALLSVGSAWSQRQLPADTSQPCALPLAGAKGFAIAGPALRWPGPFIPYEINTTDFTTAERAQIKASIEYLNQNTNICLLPHTSESDYIELSLSQGDFNSASSLGYVGGVHRVTFARNQRRHMYLHELCHLFGMIHEHQRPDRDKYVEILYYNIPNAFRPQFARYDSLPATYYWSEEYDFNSVMHYADNAFGYDGQKTIDPRNPEVTITLRDELSALDLLTLERLYPESVNCDSLYRERVLDGTLTFRGVMSEVCRNRTFEVEFVPSQGNAAEWEFVWDVPGGELVRAEGTKAYVRFLDPRAQRVLLEIRRGSFSRNYEDFIFVVDPEPQLQILGNPATGGQIDYRFSSVNERVSVLLLDLTGRVLYREQLTVRECGAEGSLSYIDYPPGIYTLALLDGDRWIGKQVTIP
jgi:hypothetical protein